MFKMDESNSHETRNIYPNLIEQQLTTKPMKLKIILLLKLKKELMSKRPSNYIASFEYFD